jgi:hypothetical protein
VDYTQRFLIQGGFPLTILGRRGKVMEAIPVVAILGLKGRITIGELRTFKAYE